jgi:Cdc6-like AAA superfamily ATPase
VARGDIVGRCEERALLETLIGRRSSAVITGASGVGKTRLAREVLDDAAAAA